MQEGNPNARKIYANTAAVAAHLVVGAMEGFAIPADPSKTVIFLHGGVYKTPGLAELQSMVTTSYLKGVELPTYQTENLFGSNKRNAGLAGAAIAAYLASR